MHVKWILFALALLLVALPAVAQDLPETFSSEDGSVSFNYPEGWGADAQAVPLPDGGQIILAFLASNESAAAKIGQQENMVLESGEVLIGVTIGQLGTMFQADANASALDLLIAATERSGQEYGIAMPFSIASRPAARATRSAAGFDELGIAISYGDGIYGYLALYAPRGELGRWENVALGVAESIQHGRAVPVPIDPTSLRMTQRFSTEDGVLSFMYPRRWVAAAQPAPGENQRTLLIGFTANSRETLQKIAQISGQTITEFEAGMAFIVGDLGTRYSLAPGARAPQVAEAVASRGNYENFELTPMEVGGRAAARITRSFHGYDATDIVLEFGEDYYALLSLYTAPGTMANWASFIQIFVENFEFNAPPKPRADALPLEQTFTTENGLLTVGYPTDWFAQQGGSSTVYLTNVEDKLGAQFGVAYNPGETQILVSVWRAEDLIARLNLPENPGSRDVLDAAVRNTPRQGGVVFGDMVTGQLNGIPASFVRVRANAFEGIALVAELAPGTFAATQVLTAPGEIHSWERTFLEVVKAIQYAGIEAAATEEATETP